jgi:hypothetical protein
MPPKRLNPGQCALPTRPLRPVRAPGGRRGAPNRRGAALPRWGQLLQPPGPAVRHWRRSRGDARKGRWRAGRLAPPSTRSPAGGVAAHGCTRRTTGRVSEPLSGSIGVRRARAGRPSVKPLHGATPFIPMPTHLAPELQRKLGPTTGGKGNKRGLRRRRIRRECWVVSGHLGAYCQQGPEPGEGLRAWGRRA